MAVSSKGRTPSLLAWGLLVGGVALLITFPGGIPPAGIGVRLLPAAFLFLLAGLVFGLSHPEGRAWTGALLLGWLPVVIGGWLLVTGAITTPVPAWLLLMVLPGVIAVIGARLGVAGARARARDASGE